MAPRAPTATPDGPVWFTSDDTGAREGEVSRSLAALDEHLAALAAEHGVNRSSIVVGGYSQGGAMAMAFALAEGGGTEPLAGLFCVSGFLPHFETVPYDLASLAAGATPCLVVHGDEDPVVPVQQGRSAARTLERNGAAVTYVEASGGHHLASVGDEAVASWLEGLAG